MLDSVRVRLTLWYTVALALFLVLLSLATYFIFRQSALRRTDSNLTELADAFLVTFRDEARGDNGVDNIRIAAREAMIEHRFRDQVYTVLDATGTVLASSQDLPSANPRPDVVPANLLSSPAFRDFVVAASHSDHLFQNLPGAPDGYRAYARHFSIRNQNFTLVILQSLHAQEEMLEEIRRTFAWIIPIAILLASAGGYFLARKSLAPVVAMSTQAGRIGAANLHERLPVQNEKDELGLLSRSFNSLLDRLDQSFERQQRFMADASHELRTPVAILRGEAEVALSRPARTSEDYRESLSVLHAEAQHLTHIVEDLFTLTRADAGQYPLSTHDFYLDELVADCVHSVRTLALAKKLSLAIDAGSELPIHADEALIRRMILNLLDNAIKYTPSGGSITVSCRKVGQEFTITITDTGPGVATGLQNRIFERFFRVDRARSRSESDGGGAGLGLAIARWIAEAHHGRLELTHSDVHGSTFTAYLPLTQLRTPLATR